MSADVIRLCDFERPKHAEKPTGEAQVVTLPVVRVEREAQDRMLYELGKKILT